MVYKKNLVPNNIYIEIENNAFRVLIYLYHNDNAFIPGKARYRGPIFETLYYSNGKDWKDKLNVPSLKYLYDNMKFVTRKDKYLIIKGILK